MFDLTSTKLFILGVVALLVVGPKELPALLRTVGKYIGMIKRQAAEFRAQFDDAMRESELADLKKEVETLGKETEAIVRDAERSVETEVGHINHEVGQASQSIGSETGSVADASAGRAGSATEAEAEAVASLPPETMAPHDSATPVKTAQETPPLETTGAKGHG